MKVFLFDIRDFEDKSPLAMPVSCSATATTTVQHVRMLAPAKRCQWTPSISPMEVATSSRYPEISKFPG